MLLQWLQEIEEHIQHSPLRVHRVLPLPLNEEYSKYLREGLQRVQTVIESAQRKLNLVLLGEVKSGKSTVVNALAGGEVAPVDTLECTSAIMEIEFAEKPFARCIALDGTQRESTVDALYGLLKRHQGDIDFFRQWKLMQIGYPLPDLRRLRIVDTPGLATLTEQNQRTTQEYIQEADVVLWVLNANTLGDLDIRTLISEVARRGKPIVIIVNRIDEVDGDAERLVLYVQEEYGLYCQAVFPLSATMAYQGVISNNVELLQKSGFNALRDYLAQQLDIQADRVKLRSIVSSATAVMRDEQLLHKNYQKELAFLRAQIDSHKREMDSKAAVIAQDMTVWLQGCINGPDIRQLVEAGVQEARQQGQAAVEQAIRQRIQSWWDGVTQQLQKEFEKRWEEGEAEFLNRFRMEAGNLPVAVQEQVLANPEIESSPLESETIMTGKAVQGAVLGTGAGLAASVITAHALHAALLPIAALTLPQFVLIGAIAGAVAALKRFVRAGEDSDRMEAVVRQCQDVLSKQVETELSPRIQQACEQTAHSVHEHFVQSVANGFSSSEMRSFESELEEYIVKMQTLIEKESDIL